MPRFFVTFPARAAKALAVNSLALSLIFSAGCRDDPEDHEFPPAINVGDAEPQDSPIPSGGASDATVPQIKSLDAPDEVLPGQVVGLRLTTDYMPREDLAGAAVIIDGLDGWYRFEVDPQPAAGSDAGAWVVTISLAIAEDPEDDAIARISVALLGPGDGAGAYRNWAPDLKGSETSLDCPADADCGDQSCGLDPLCATECGMGCDATQACNLDFVCEDIGDACPAAAACGEQECGIDPVCGTECGTCEAGQYCTIDGTCTYSGGGRFATAFATGPTASHNCAIFDDASVSCWGANMWGQLGLGDLQTRGDQPGEMGGDLPALELGGEVQAVVVGDEHSCALRTDGDIVCWGSAESGALGTGSTATIGDQAGEMGDDLSVVDLDLGSIDSLCAGDQFNCALDSGGTVKCWGRNDYGQLAQGNTTNLGNLPDQLGSSLVAVALTDDAKTISCGRHHACAVLNSGDLQCWGRNDWGQLGLEDTEHRGDDPDEVGAMSPIDLGSGRSAIEISSGSQHSCALLDNDEVKCWGQGFWGNLGLERIASEGDEPGEMGDGLDALDLGEAKPVGLSSGDRHSCALFDDGGVRCWGYPWALGVGDTQGRGHIPGTMGDGLERVELAGLAVQGVYSASDYTCAILAEGRAQCWGFNNYGQLGLEDTLTRGDEPGEMGFALPIVEL